MPRTLLQGLVEADVVGFTLEAGDCIVDGAWEQAVVDMDAGGILDAAPPVSCEACTGADALCSRVARGRIGARQHGEIARAVHRPRTEAAETGGGR